MKANRKPKRPAAALSARRSHNPDWLWVAALVLLVVAAYWPTLANDFIWDDDYYVQNNVTLTSAAGLLDIWFKFGATPQYYPLVFTTFWGEYHLWGLAPWGYHVVNLLLHAASAVMVWRLLTRLQVPGAWLAGAIFAVHPVEVESVAWITERKNVLSCACALGSLLAYLNFSPAIAEGGGATDSVPLPRWRYYGLALLLYAAALLSKTVTASLPAVLLVVYWWKRGRVEWREALRLAPFFAVGLALAGVTVWMEKTHVGATGDDWDYSALDRVLIAGRVAWFYVGKLLWPYPLVFFYPRWSIDSSSWWQYSFPAAALLLVVGLWLARRSIGRGPLAAVLIFGGVLVPALGFFDVYPFRYSFVADHFQYHASLAIISLAAAAAAIFMRRFAAQPVWLAPLAATCLLAILGAMTFQKVFVYKNQETLYRDVIALNPAAWMAHNNLGILLKDQGRTREANEHFRAAMDLLPKEDWYRNLGSAIYQSGRLDEAAQALRGVLLKDLDAERRANTHIDLGNILAVQGRLDDAIDQYQQALIAHPGDWKGLSNLGEALRQKGDLSGAIAALQASLEINANHPFTLNSLGSALSAAGRHPEAVGRFEQAVQAQPSSALYHKKLGDALLTSGDLSRAEHELRRSLSIAPRDADTHNLLGAALGQRGDLAAAIQEFVAALAIDPGNKAAADNLQKARAALGRGD